MTASPPSKKPRPPDDEEEDPAVTRFREYLRIKTVAILPDDTTSPKPDYEIAVQFLIRMADEIGIPYKCIEVAPGRVVVLMTWEGTRPELKAVMLNSHYDVVPVWPEHWSEDPFTATKKENGDIVARGTQDMKCVGMQHLESVRRLKSAGKRFPRTIYITFQPDEEVGSLLGMMKWVKHEEFLALNVGYALDESLPNPTDAFTVFRGERISRWFTVTCTGNPGHGSRFIENTAVEKVHKIMTSALSYREAQQQKLKSDPTLTIGDVTSINVTRLNGGVQYNVVPSEMSIGFDIRVTPTDDAEEVMSRVQQWLTDAGVDCTLTPYHCGDSHAPLTSTDPSDPWWKAFTGACSKRGMRLEVEISPVGTDARLLRANGIPSLGFTAMNHTPILVHDHNEFLNERAFLAGIEIHEDVVAALASVEGTN